MANFPSLTRGTGTGALFVPDNYKFNDSGARDTYFRNKLGELKKQTTYIMVGSQLQVWMGSSNPQTYTNTNWQSGNAVMKGDKGDKGADGAGVDLSALSNKEIPVFDAAQNRLVPSGVVANDGDITIAPSSVIFGDHKMSSSIDTVIFKNTDTNVNYAPVWQTIAPGADDAFLRDHSAEQEVVRVPSGSVDVTNPVNTGIVIDADETFFGGKFTLSQAATNVEMSIINEDGDEVWRDLLGSLNAGEHEFTFDTPFDIRKGYTYDIHLKSQDGSDVVAKSNSSVGFSWTVKRSTFTDKELATQEWVQGLSSNSTSLVLFNIDKDLLASDVTSGTKYFIYNGNTDATLKLPSLSTLPDDTDVAVMVTNNGGDSNKRLKVTPTDASLIGPGNTTEFYLPQNYTTLFLSHKTHNRWYYINIERGSGSGISPSGKYVTEVVAGSDGKSVVLSYSDGSSKTVKIDGYVADIDKFNTAFTQLQNQFRTRTKAFVYYGQVAPDYPNRTKGAYYLTFHNVPSAITTTTPTSTSGVIQDGTIFFIDNVDGVHDLTVNATPGRTINGTSQKIIKPNVAAWYVLNGIDWQELFSGYIPESYQSLLTQLKADLPSSKPGGAGDKPTKFTPEFWGMFSNSIPTDLTGATKASGKRVTLTRTAGPQQRAMLMIPSAYANHVTGMKELGGIDSLWPKRDSVTLDGESFTVFYSNRGYNELSATFIVDFSQGDFYV